MRKRDGLRRQVRQLQPDGVHRLRHEHRLEIEQAEVLPARTRTAVVGSDPTKLQFECAVLLVVACVVDVRGKQEFVLRSVTDRYSKGLATAGAGKVLRNTSALPGSEPAA